ncbi:MAG TPA: hypothetical protein DCQ06_06500, partial [Myxococcales bacterium]|nr:hypothetical protein [Myxococcales bacterium]
MSLTLLLVVMVIFAFGCSHWLAQRASRHSGPSGIEYVILGWLLGPQLEPHILTEQYLDTLAPLINLMLGLVGFIVGIRAKRLVVRADAALAGTLLSFAIAIAVGLVVLVVQYRFGLHGSDANWVVNWPIYEVNGWLLELRATAGQLWLALALGAAACVCGASVVERHVQVFSGSLRTRRFLTSVSSTSELLSLSILGLTLAAARSETGATQLGMGVTEWVVAAVGLGVLCGALFTLLIGRQRQPMRMFLTGVGVVTFASGIGAAIGVSPLFVNLLLGLTVSSISPHADELIDEVARLRQPVNVLVLVFAGALWTPVQGWQWCFPLVYVVVRYGVLRLVTPMVARHTLEAPLYTRRIGHALIGQGGVAVAVAVGVALRFPKVAPVALTTVLASTLVGDVWSDEAVRGVLLDADDQGQDSAPDESSADHDLDAQWAAETAGSSRMGESASDPEQINAAIA